METGNTFEKKILPTNSQINFRKSHKIWGKNKPFKSYLKKLDKGVVTTPLVGIGLRSNLYRSDFRGSYNIWEP